MTHPLHGEPSTYVIQKTDRSRCNYCHGYLDILIDDENKPEDFPIFYICWTCKKVFECGRSEVEREGEPV